MKLNHTWKPGSWIKPHLYSDQRFCAMSEMFFVRNEKNKTKKNMGVLHQYKIKRIRPAVVCVFEGTAVAKHASELAFEQTSCSLVENITKDRAKGNHKQKKV